MPRPQLESFVNRIGFGAALPIGSVFRVLNIISISCESLWQKLAFALYKRVLRICSTPVLLYISGRLYVCIDTATAFFQEFGACFSLRVFRSVVICTCLYLSAIADFSAFRSRYNSQSFHGFFTLASRYLLVGWLVG